MILKKLGLSLVAVLAIGAVIAGSALGAVETKAAQWYTQESATPMTGSKGITASIGSHPVIGSNAQFTTEIGGKAVELSAGEITCNGCTIENKVTSTSASPIAFGAGEIAFKEVTVAKPTGCTIKSETNVTGEVVTKALRIHGDFMDTETTNKHAFIQFIPTIGGTFAQFKLSGGECSSITGTYNVTGSVFGESGKNKGEFADPQALIVGSSVQSTTGAGLTVGVKPAVLTGTAIFALTSGETFAIK